MSVFQKRESTLSLEVPNPILVELNKERLTLKRFKRNSSFDQIELQCIYADGVPDLLVLQIR